MAENKPYVRNGKGKAYELPNLVHGWSTTTRITDVRGDLNGQWSKTQSYNVISSVWRMFAHNSTKNKDVADFGRSCHLTNKNINDYHLVRKLRYVTLQGIA